MNGYEAMKKILEIDVKMQEVGNKLANAANINETIKYEKMLDDLEIEFFTLKDALEKTTLQVNIY